MTAYLARMLVLVFLTAVGLGFRVGVLAAQGTTWFDEAFSLHFAQLPWGEMLRLLSYDVHPPLFAVVLKAWIGLFGADATAARWLSVLCGTALIPVVYAVGREMEAGERRHSHIGLVAAGLVAASPLLAFHSAEARMYPLLILLVAGAMFAWLRASRAGAQHRHWETAWAVLGGLALLVHLMAALPFGIMAVAGAWERRADRGSLRNWCVGAFLASLPFVLWLASALWHRLPTLGGEWQFVAAKAGWGPGVLADFFVYGTDGVTRLVAAIAAWFLVVLGARAAASSASSVQLPVLGPVAWLRFWLLALATAPIALLTAMPRAAIKYAFVGVPAAAVLIAAGAVWAWQQLQPGHVRRAITALVASAFAAALVSPMLAQLEGPRFRWNKVGEYIEARERPGDLVYASWFVMELSLREHYRGALPVASAYPYDPALRFDERLVRHAGNVRYPPSVFDELDRRLVDHQRVFVVVGGDDLVSSPIVEWFLTHGWHIEDRLHADRFTPGVVVLTR